MDDQRSLEAQLLGDMTYDDPRKHQPAQTGPDPRLADASAVLLDDMNDTPAAAPKPQTRYQELTDEQIAILQQQRAEKGQPPYTPEEIAELKAEFIERQRTAAMQQAMAEQAAAQQQAAAMLLEEPEDAYAHHEKKEAPKILPEVDASALLEEPAPEPERKVVFNQEDLEAAKKQATKRAAESLSEAPSQTEEQQKRAQMEMRELRRQQQADLAAAGFKVSVVMTILGILAGVGTLFFGMGKSADDAASIFGIFDTVFLVAGALIALLSITIVTRVKGAKGFLSFLTVVTPIALATVGLADLLSAKKGMPGFGVTVAGYLLGIAGCAIVTFNVSSNEKLGAYYDRKDTIDF